MNFLFHFYDLQQRAGIQRAICELANALVEHGDEVVVATHSTRSEVAYNLDDRVVIEGIPYAATRGSGPLVWPARVLWGIRQIGVLRKIIRRYQPQLIVDHGTALGFIYPFKKMGGVPFVLQRHFPVHGFPHGKLLLYLLRPLCARRTVVVLTKSIAKDMALLGYRHIVAIPNVIPADAKPTSYFEAIPKTGILIGRSRTPQKGFDIFLEALAITKMPGWHFSIIGPACDSDPLLLKLIHKYDLANQVSLLPATDDPYQKISKSSCLIMPSRYEGLGLVALEALSIGRPVIASDADGLRDLVIDNVNGFIFPCGDVNGLSKCLEHIRDNPTLLKKFASHTFLSIKPFDANLIIGKWRKIAAFLCGKRPDA